MSRVSVSTLTLLFFLILRLCVGYLDKSTLAGPSLYFNAVGGFLLRTNRPVFDRLKHILGKVHKGLLNVKPIKS